MQLNSLFFRSPKPTYDTVSICLIPNSELLYISSHQQVSMSPCLSCRTLIKYCAPTDSMESRRVPVLLIKNINREVVSNKYLIFFHSNSEDMNNSYQLLWPLALRFQLNLVLVEYPGYGIYLNNEASAESLSEDAIAVYNYFLSVRKIEQNNIVVMGRSMGSGPASLLAAKYQPRALILISPYSSLRDVASNIVGKILAKLVKDRFANVQIISQATCPLLVIHGKKDDLIPLSQAQLVLSAAGSKIKKYHFPDDMDLAEPLALFFRKIDFIEESQMRIEPLKSIHSKAFESSVSINELSSITKQRSIKRKKSTNDSYKVAMISLSHPNLEKSISINEIKVKAFPFELNQKSISQEQFTYNQRTFIF